MRDCTNFWAWLAYYMKDNGEDHFEFVNFNVLSDDVNEEKMEYAKIRQGWSQELC